MTRDQAQPPVEAEVVHEGRRARVVRVHLGGRTIIRKEPLGPGAEAGLRHETMILELLRGARGVAQLLDSPRYPGALVLEDVGSASVADLTKPLAADELMALAVDLVRALAEVHSRGVIHGNISPSNIVISSRGDPYLVDFAMGARFAEIRPQFGPHSEILGTLAYIAPEQTGRTARSVDHRADLYALGATLYELAVGEPPFGFGDPLRLVHDHLVRMPVAPAEIDPGVPAPLSQVVMRLLEKEPDRRYQTAEGVGHDLERLRAAGSAPKAAQFRLGERDVPVRLLPPSRMVGRESELAALEAAFEDAMAGRCRAVLVSGGPGVGKTTLVDELRPVVTRRSGWLVAGKFDQYRRDLEFDAVNQAFRALGRLLLAEPEAELVAARERILDEAGPSAGILVAALPEFATLLAVPPDPGDPLTAHMRAARAGLAVVRAAASVKRPLVLFLDDLQWVGPTPLRFVELVLSEEPVEGLLLVGAYRPAGVDGAHPLAAPLSRWGEQADVRQLRLENLASPDVIAMISEMLRLDPVAAAPLAESIGSQTSGNPYEIVELLNALRRDHVLTPTSGGWTWDAATVRAHLDGSETAGPLLSRGRAMPVESRHLVEAMACLGGRADPTLLQVAIDQPAVRVERTMASALEAGVLVVEPGPRQTVRFRHDRTRDAILDGLDAEERRVLQLAMARRLAKVPELFAVAAEQYLPAVDAIADPAERRHAVTLLRRAADQAALIGDYPLVCALLTAAVRLIDPRETSTLAEVHVARHVALFSLGKLDEADEEYAAIERLSASAIQRAGATVVQLYSLVNRTRFAEASALGLAALGELGISVPVAGRLSAELDQQFGYLYRWLETDTEDDLARPDITNPRLVAGTSVINALVPAAWNEPSLYAWLALEALRIWVEHGPGPTVIGPAGHTAFAAVLLRGDYTAAYRTARRLLAVGEARGYEPGTSQTRMVRAVHGWIAEPLENLVETAEQARKGLIAGADPGYASYTYYPTAAALLDSAPSLDDLAAEVEAGMAFAARIGSEQIGQWLNSYRWLARVLRGETTDAGEEAAVFDGYVQNPTALFLSHVNRALVAALFGDAAGLAQHSAAALPLLPAGANLYTSALARLLHGLALAQAGRSDEPHSELDEVIRWLGARAVAAPDNFLHMLHLLEAERSWAGGDSRAAALAFDAGMRAVAGRQRPWHRALIAERAARFYLARGVDQIGAMLIAQARRDYLAWGASAKVTQLDYAFPTRRLTAYGEADDVETSDALAPVTTGAIDLLGILSASQALSSETSIRRLQARVVQVLGEMTGATSVHLALWNEDRREWLATAPTSRVGSIDGDDVAQPLPMSVLRYVQRVLQPVVVANANDDERFAGDPYFVGVDCCSLLVSPVFTRGILRAALVLENRLIRGAFTTERLDAVKLIAGQLAVSLDNAQLYEENRRVAEEQASLRRVATLVAQGAAPEVVFGSVAEEVGKLFADVDVVAIGRYTAEESIEFVGDWSALGMLELLGKTVRLGGHNVSTAVFETGRPARVDHLVDDATPLGEHARRAGARSSASAPIIVEGRLWGSVSVGCVHEGGLPAGIEDELAAFTELVGTAIAKAQAGAELTASRARIVTAADESRRRIVRDLHDGAQQSLVQTIIMLKQAKSAHDIDDDEQARALVVEALERAERANTELRELAQGILPGVLRHGGLSAGVKQLVSRVPVPVRLNLTRERFAPEIEANAYFVIAEALTNVVKHSQAEHADVQAWITDGALHMEIRDNGMGGADPEGSGLTGLSDRVSALGGRLRVDSRPGEGTQISATLPL